MISAATAGGLYAAALQATLLGERVPGVASPTSPGAGRPSREWAGVTYRLADPRARLALSADRPLNVAFPVGAFLRFLAGDGSVAGARYYNGRAPEFSDDGMTLRGAYGPRAARHVGAVVQLLRHDPGTRRAVLSVFSSSRDLSPSRDVPCPLDVQFLVRRGRVDCLATFRSQSAYGVLPYDVAFMTLLHEHVAVQAGYEPGAYVQWTGSLHLYEDEVDAALRVVRGAVATAWMPPMAPIRDVDMEHTLLAYETTLRVWAERASAVPWANADHPPSVLRGLPPYWDGVAGYLRRVAVRKRAGEELRGAAAVDELLDAFRDAGVEVGPLPGEAR